MNTTYLWVAGICLAALFSLWVLSPAHETETYQSDQTQVETPLSTPNTVEEFK